MLYLDTFSENDFRRLDAVRADHCVSIFMPTHPDTREARQDKVLFSQLIKDVAGRLGGAGADKRRVSAIEEHLRDLLDDGPFWAFLAEGLAVFATPEQLQTYRVPMRLAQEVEISDRFHLKLLIPLLAFQRTAYLLDIAQNQVRLLEVTEGGMREIHVPGMPRDIGGAMDERGMDNREILKMQTSADKKVRQRQFCRAIERAMRAFLRGQTTPLVLAGVDTILTYYRQADTYAHTEAETISRDQDYANPDDLAQRVRDIAAPRADSVIRAFLDRVEELRSVNRSSTDAMEIARAAKEGRVERLLVNLDETLYGTLRGGIGRAAPGAAASVSTYDVLDELAGLTIRNGGGIIAAHADKLPSGLKAAAVFRYAA